MTLSFLEGNFLTLEALGKLDEMHGKVFDAVHRQRIRLNRDDATIDWVAKNGIDRATFLNDWNSFGVQARRPAGASRAS